MKAIIEYRIEVMIDKKFKGPKLSACGVAPPSSFGQPRLEQYLSLFVDHGDCPRRDQFGRVSRFDWPCVLAQARGIEGWPVLIRLYESP